MSNKAISMCPDQGPQVLTPSNLAGVPGVCDIFIREANPPLLSFLRHFPFPPPLVPAGRRRGHVTALHPRETRDAGYATEERERGSSRERWRPSVYGERAERGRDRGGEGGGGRAVSTPS